MMDKNFFFEEMFLLQIAFPEHSTFVLRFMYCFALNELSLSTAKAERGKIL
jgi:hypothetical protein